MCERCLVRPASFPCMCEPRYCAECWPAVLAEQIAAEEREPW
jgi:hypothetical protein